MTTHAFGSRWKTWGRLLLSLACGLAAPGCEEGDPAAPVRRDDQPEQAQQPTKQTMQNVVGDQILQVVEDQR